MQATTWKNKSQKIEIGVKKNDWKILQTNGELQKVIPVNFT